MKKNRQDINILCQKCKKKFSLQGAYDKSIANNEQDIRCPSCGKSHGKIT